MFCSDIITTKTYKPCLSQSDSTGAYTESDKAQHRKSLAMTDYIKSRKLWPPIFCFASFSTRPFQYLASPFVHHLGYFGLKFTTFLETCIRYVKDKMQLACQKSSYSSFMFMWFRVIVQKCFRLMQFTAAQMIAHHFQFHSNLQILQNVNGRLLSQRVKKLQGHNTKGLSGEMTKH